MTRYQTLLTIPRTVEFNKDCELWLYAGDDRHLLWDATSVKVEIEIFGNRNGTLTFSLQYGSHNWDYLTQEGAKYIEFRRCGVQEACYRVLSHNRSRSDNRRDGEAQVMCGPMICDLDAIVILPDLAHEEVNWHYYGTPDDILKQLIREQVVPGLALPMPNGTERGLARWTVAANKTEHPAWDTTLFARGEYVAEKLMEWACAHDFVDFDAYIDWHGGEGLWSIVFETWYPRRGVDASRINADGNPWVFLNDAGYNLHTLAYHEDETTERNAIYDSAMTKVEKDDTRIATHGLREMISEGRGQARDVRMKADLAENVAARGFNWRVWQNPHFRYGQHARVGDKISVNSALHALPTEHKPIKRVTLEYPDRFEQITLLLGDPEPDVQKKSGGEPQPEIGEFSTTVLPIAAENIVGDSYEYNHSNHRHRGAINTLGWVGEGLAFLDIGPDDLGAWKFTAGTGMRMIWGAGNEVTFHTDWERGGGALYPWQGGDDVCLRNTSKVNTIWLEGQSGMSHFADDMFLGGAAGVADSRLHIKDSGEGRYGARITFQTGGYKGQMGLSDDGELFMHTHQAQGISLIVQGTQKFYLFDDGAQAAFENGGLVAGYEGMSSTGGVANDPGWSLNNTSGDLYLDEDATTTIGGYCYTWPKSGGAANKVLGISSIAGAAVALGWIDLASMLQGSAQYQILVTGPTPFAAAWSAISNLAGAGLAAASGVLAVGAGNGLTVNADDVALTTPGTLTATTTNSASGSHTHAVTASTTGVGNAGALAKFNAQGNLVVTSNLYVMNANSYLYAVSGQMGLVTDQTYLVLSGPGGALIWGNNYFYKSGGGGNLGDTSTSRWGEVNATTGNFSGTVIGAAFQVRADCYLGSHAANYLNLYAGQYVSFAPGGSFLAFVGDNAFFPASSVSLDLGKTDRRLRDMYLNGTIKWSTDSAAILYRSTTSTIKTDGYLVAALGLTSLGDVLFYGDGASNRSLASHRHGTKTGGWTGFPTWSTRYDSNPVRVWGASTIIEVYVRPVGGGTAYWTQCGIGSAEHQHTLVTPYGTPGP